MPPSTLTLLDELGLGAQFRQLPHRIVEQAQVEFGDHLVQVGDFRRIPGPHKHLAFVPQWDFLDLLADAVRVEPTFAPADEHRGDRAAHRERPGGRRALPRR